MTAAAARRLSAHCAGIGAVLLLGGLLAPDSWLPLEDVSRYAFLVPGGVLLVALGGWLALRAGGTAEAEAFLREHGEPVGAVLRSAQIGGIGNTRIYTWEISGGRSWREATLARPGMVPGRSAVVRVHPDHPEHAVLEELGPHPWGTTGEEGTATVVGWRRGELDLELPDGSRRVARGDFKRIPSGRTVPVVWSAGREDALAAHQVAERRT